MTETPPPPSDDEISASLDGEADAEVRARISADPAAAARRDELAAAARALRDLPPPALDPATVDALVARAMDEPIAPVVPLRRRAAARTWLVAACVLLLLGIGLTMVWSGRQSDEQAKFTKVGASINAESSAQDSAGSLGHAGASGAGSAPATTIAPSAAMDAQYLGRFTSGATLREALAAAFPAPSTGSTGGPAGVAVPTPPRPEAIARCAQQLQVALALQDDPTKVGYATVDGRPVLVYEYAYTSSKDQQATTLVAAVGQDACDEVVFFER